MRVLSLCRPGGGGVYGVFRSLRQGLASYGIDLRWVEGGLSVSRSLQGSATPGDLSAGEVIVPEEGSPEKLARALFDYITHYCPDLVLLHVLGGPVETSLAQFLPKDIRRVLLVHSITPATYRAARAVRDCVHGTIGVSPRIRDDLIHLCSFDSWWTFVIPNAIDLDFYRSAPRDQSSAGPLRVLVHSRMDGAAKGIYWIPGIINRALRAGANMEVTVSGDGPDLPRLKEQIASLGIRESVHFIGWSSTENVPKLMRAHDVLLFPSRFEGLPLGLVEAMAAGCVPVASCIRGVTNFVVRDGAEGLLFPVGDAKAAADKLVRLDLDRSLLARLSAAGRHRAASRFGLANQAAEYRQVFQQVMENPRPIRAPLPIGHWKMPRLLQPGWWYPMPEGVKNAARVVRERWAPWLVRLTG